MPLSTLTPPVTYFSAIGIGFMLIEISQMQRLMVFLGHPVYGLSVVLFTILLFGGIGSTTVGARSPRPGAVIARIVALLATLVVAGLLTPLADDLGAIGSDRHAHRVVGTAAGAAGVLHGDDVPARPEHLAPPRRAAPFFWSANGITSMLASVLGMALSIEFGIARTYALGVGFYVVCAVMIVVSRQANRMACSRRGRTSKKSRPRPVIAPSSQSTRLGLASAG